MSGPFVTITEHAIDRYIERVEAVPRREARARMLSHKRAICRAAEFGATYVKLSSRARLICVGYRVVSVYGASEPPLPMPQGFWPRSMPVRA